MQLGIISQAENVMYGYISVINFCNVNVNLIFYIIYSYIHYVITVLPFW